MNKKSKNGDAPATLHDLEVWGGNLAANTASLEVRLEKVEVRLEKLEVRLEKVEVGLYELKEEVAKHGRILEAILGVLESIQGQLKEMIRVPESVENHEERITKLEVKVRIMQK